MTQKELGEAVGIKAATVSRLENNQQLPSLQLCFEIASVLGLKDKINRLFSAKENSHARRNDHGDLK